MSTQDDHMFPPNEQHFLGVYLTKVINVFDYVIWN